MIISIDYGSSKERIARVIRYVAFRRSLDRSFRVVDIGGHCVGWTKDIADLIVDINAPKSSKTLAIDICNERMWASLFEIVNENGKFDYAICTHTLEDIYNPISVLDFIPRIAKAGIIAVPSLITELSNVESPYWLGYIHHRWMFDQTDGKMILVPKLGFLESEFRGLVAKANPGDPPEIRYEWQDDIPYQNFMNNYLGPDPRAVINNYRSLVHSRLECIARMSGL